MNLRILNITCSKKANPPKMAAAIVEEKHENGVIEFAGHLIPTSWVQAKVKKGEEWVDEWRHRAKLSFGTHGFVLCGVVNGKELDLSTSNCYFSSFNTYDMRKWPLDELETIMVYSSDPKAE
jgi:hypothetical protein